MSLSLTATEAVERSQTLFAYAWMVRTFVKHSPEVEEFPELMQVVRTIFDVSRSLEQRIDDPAAYFRQLDKKMYRLRNAAAQFREDAPLASTHMNFQQAVRALDGCVTEWDELLEAYRAGTISGLNLKREQTDQQPNQSPSVQEVGE